MNVQPLFQEYGLGYEQFQTLRELAKSDLYNGPIYTKSQNEEYQGWGKTITALDEILDELPDTVYYDTNTGHVFASYPEIEGELLIDGHYGIYIPQYFYEEYMTDEEQKKYSALANVESEYYWETWDDVLSCNTMSIEKDGKYLHQDDDLWLVSYWPDFEEIEEVNLREFLLGELNAYV